MLECKHGYHNHKRNMEIALTQFKRVCHTDNCDNLKQGIKYNWLDFLSYFSFQNQINANNKIYTQKTF